MATTFLWNFLVSILLQDKLETLNMTEITSGLLFHTGITSPPQPLSLWHPLTLLIFLIAASHWEPHPRAQWLWKPSVCFLEYTVNIRSINLCTLNIYINIAICNFHITRDVNPHQPGTFAAPFTSRLFSSPKDLLFKTKHLLPPTCLSLVIQPQLAADWELSVLEIHSDCVVLIFTCHSIVN